MDFNFLQPQKLDLQVRGVRAPALQQPQHSEAFNQFMEAQDSMRSPTMRDWVKEGNDYKAFQEQQANQQANQLAMQEKQKQERIAQLESEIAQVKARIENTKKNLSMVDSNAINSIMTREARKINIQDPTSLYRWKIGKDVADARLKEDLKQRDLQNDLAERKFRWEQALSNKQLEDEKTNNKNAESSTVDYWNSRKNLAGNKNMTNAVILQDMKELDMAIRDAKNKKFSQDSVRQLETIREEYEKALGINKKKSDDKKNDLNGILD